MSMSDIEVKTLQRLACVISGTSSRTSRSPVVTCQVAGSPDETIPEMEEDPLGDQVATGDRRKDICEAVSK